MDQASNCSDSARSSQIKHITSQIPLSFLRTSFKNLLSRSLIMPVTRSKRTIKTEAVLPFPTKVAKVKKEPVSRSPKKPKLNIEEMFQVVDVPADLLLPQSYIDHHDEAFIKGVNYIISKDPTLYPVIVHSPFEVFAKKETPVLLDQEKIQSYWYALIKSVLGQQISGSAAKAIEVRFNQLLEGNCTPQALLEHDPEKVRSVGLLGQKLKYITHISEVFNNPESTLKNPNFYKDSTNDELVEELTKLKGIGEWLAKMFSVFTLKELDIFAYDDLGVARGVSRYLANRPQLLQEVKDGVHSVEVLKAGLKKKGKFMTPSSKRDWVPLHDEYVKFLGLMHAPYQLVFMLIMWRLAATNVEVLENIR